MIHLAYEAGVGRLVQYRWMYPFKKYMYSLKKKVKNKVKVESSIMKAYIIEKNFNFNRYYFNHNVYTKLIHMCRNDDSSGEGSEWEIQIIAYPTHEFEQKIRQILTDIRIRQVEIYILLNCEKVD